MGADDWPDRIGAVLALSAPDAPQLLQVGLRPDRPLHPRLARFLQLAAIAGVRVLVRRGAEAVTLHVQPAPVA